MRNFVNIRNFVNVRNFVSIRHFVNINFALRTKNHHDSTVCDWISVPLYYGQVCHDRFKAVVWLLAVLTMGLL